jgi:cell division protein FtsL
MTNDEVLVVLFVMVGLKYNDALKDEIAKLTGRTRVVGPNEPSTMELDNSRIHVIAGGNGVITGFRFG